MLNMQRDDVIVIRNHSLLKLERVREQAQIHLRNIDMASEAVAADSDNAGWFCLSVTMGREFAVEKVLKQHGVKACVPRCKGERVRRRHGGMKEPVLPVVQGYVLVFCAYDWQAFSGLRSIDGVHEILSDRRGPYRINRKYIEHFIKLADEGQYDHRPLSMIWKEGDQAQVIDGPFASFGAIIKDVSKLDSQGLVKVDVSIFGRSTMVEMHAASLQIVKTVGVDKARKIR